MSKSHSILLQPESAYLNDTVIFGPKLNNENDEGLVYYIDDERSIKNMVINAKGEFCNFPGVIENEFWLKELSDISALNNKIRFRTSIENFDGKFAILWNIQPDGRYWEDEDGFGATNDLEITLYSFLDIDGNIAQPFKIFRLGTKTYYEYTQNKVITKPENNKVISDIEDKSAEISNDQTNLNKFNFIKDIIVSGAFILNAAAFVILFFLTGEYDSYYGKSNPFGSVFEYMLEDILPLYLLLLVFLNFTIYMVIISLKKSILKGEAKDVKNSFKLITFEKKPKQKSEPETQAIPEPEAEIIPEPENISQETDIPSKNNSQESKVENDSSISSVADELIKLKQLLDDGIITQKEFNSIKKRLLKL